MKENSKSKAIHLGEWLADTKFGNFIYPNHVRKAFFIFLLAVHSIYWFTAWWSPWPFLIFNAIGLWFSQGILAPWGTIIYQAIQSKYDSAILKITILFIVLNYIAIFASLYMFGSLIGSNGEEIHGVWSHFYFSAITLTTLGYGNIVPGDMYTEVIATIQAIIGFMGFAVLAGIVATITIKRISNKEPNE